MRQEEGGGKVALQASGFIHSTEFSLQELLKGWGGGQRTSESFCFQHRLGEVIEVHRGTWVPQESFRSLILGTRATWLECTGEQARRRAG
jgi:hypothetical protein